MICTNDDLHSIELVPSKVEYVYWDKVVCLVKIHPLKNRNLFAGDQMKVADTSRWEWYVIDLNMETVHRFINEQSYRKQLETMGIDPDSIKLMTLRKAWSRSEKELGFDFNYQSIEQFLEVNR